MTCQSCEETKRQIAALQEDGRAFLINAAMTCRTCEMIGPNGERTCALGCCGLKYEVMDVVLKKVQCPLGKW